MEQSQYIQLQFSILLDLDFRELCYVDFLNEIGNICFFNILFQELFFLLEFIVYLESMYINIRLNGRYVFQLVKQFILLLVQFFIIFINKYIVVQNNELLGIYI